MKKRNFFEVFPNKPQWFKVMFLLCYGCFAIFMITGFYISMCSPNVPDSVNSYKFPEMGASPPHYVPPLLFYVIVTLFIASIIMFIIMWVYSILESFVKK